MKNIIITLISVLLATSFCLAADPKPEDFAGSDKKLNFEEFFLYQYAIRDPKTSEIDTDGNSIISVSERRAFAGTDWPPGSSPENSKTITIDEARGTVPPPSKKNWGTDWLRLRKDHDSLLKKVGDADPASLGFFRNNLDDENTWAVEGALGVVLPLVDRKSISNIGNYYLEELNFIGSGTLNRVTGTGDGTLEVADSLAFRAGLSGYLQARNEVALWDYQILSLNYRAEGSTQDGDFKSAGEFDWEPMRYGREGEWVELNGPFHPPFRNYDINFHFRYTFSSHFEFGEDQTGASFAKMGPKVGIAVKPNPKFLPNLSLFANYTYLWEFGNGPQDFDYLETGGRWALDKAEQVFLEGKYRYGQLPAKYTDIDVFQLSLAVKF